MSIYFLLSLFLLQAVNANSVVELSDDNFVNHLEDVDTALVMFYAPWCGHCKKLKPEFDKASKDLASNDPPVTLAKVDCTEGGKDLCSQYDVKGYPTLKIFKNGEVSGDYDKGRDANAIVKTMKAQVEPASKEIESEADLKQFLDNQKETVVVFYGDDKDDLAVFSKVANALRESMNFGHFTGSKSKKNVVLHRAKVMQTKLEESELKFEGKVTKEKLTDWLEDNYHGIVGHRTNENAKDFKFPLVIAYFGVDYVKNAKGSNYWRNRVMKVAKNHPKQNYAISNKDDFMNEMEQLGLSSYEDKPKVGVIAGSKKYAMTEDFSIENFEKFLTAYEKGEIEAHIKSEPIPDNTDAGVKVAVAKNFEELVEKSEKDVLIEFYAPWCGHCKSLAPTYDQLGEKMKDENVEIVKMDATANDVPDGYDVRGFPTLYWVPKGTKKPESYNSGRDLDSFVKFIAENASDELKKYDRSGKEKKTEL